MNNFTDKVAVITGGANGIGLAVAQLAAQKGMKLVLADIEQTRLDTEVQALVAAGHQAIGVYCDVSKLADIENLAAQALATFGGVHFLFNNAGVGSPGANIWETTAKDWEWVLGVNVWSIIHAMNVFVPIMLAQDQPSHIINTASIAGLISGPSMGIYRMSKHAVVAMSETLYHELGQKEAQIGVSVLCPAWVKTGIFRSERNRPKVLANSDKRPPMDALIRAQVTYAAESVEAGIPPSAIAEAVFAAMCDNEFYILTHPKFSKAIAVRMDDILESGRNPTNLLR